MRPRRIWLVLGALTLAVLDSASGGATSPEEPEVCIDGQHAFGRLNPSFVAGEPVTVAGYVIRANEVFVAVDGGPRVATGRREPGDTQCFDPLRPDGAFRRQFTGLAEGLHEVRVTVVNAAGSTSLQRSFFYTADSTATFGLVFDPDQVTLDPGSDVLPGAFLRWYGAVDLNLSLETEVPGIEFRDPRGYTPIGDGGEDFISLRYQGAEPGQHVLTVRGTRDGEQHTADLTVNVIGPVEGEPIPEEEPVEAAGPVETEPVETAQPPVPGDSYEVITVVTVSNVEGVAPVGAQSESTWTFAFGCPDGRCDAEIGTGGPFGSLPPFTATYRPDTEDFVFDFILETPANPQCGDDRWVGEIAPDAWDERGPVEFTVSLINVLECDTGDAVIEWEGQGVRG